MEESVVDRGVNLPVGEVKFDAHASGVPNGYLNQFSRLPDNLKKYGLTSLSTRCHGFRGVWFF